ncbi:hypothetical protein GJU40_18785 [Bacillus lacus]|uniref:Uncharacterized protein n=1 Tax=Metabacillus lacus TaxID=1983721 RepID=A0A7X2J2J3_9BACI|nr:hypothetical protein [Metabacillus lacus]MRX74171.1 hypothetical protein [Metabacillus lacus]
MNSIWKLTLTMTLAAALIAGCGTSSNNTSSNPEEPQQSPVEENETQQPQSDENEDAGNANGGNSNEGKETPPEQDSAVDEANETQPEEDNQTEEGSQPEEDEDSGQMIRLFEQNITYQAEGQMYEETGFLQESENQDFSMYVTEDFQLEAEEPGRDILFYKENDAISMRIELLADDADWEVIEKASVEQIQEVSSEYEENAWAGDWSEIEGTTLLSANNEDTIFHILVVKDHPSLPAMKLTLQTPLEGSMSTKMAEMAKTIQNKQ